MTHNKLKIALAMAGAMIPFVLQADDQVSTSLPETLYKSGEQIKGTQLPGAYDQSASYDLSDRWDIFVVTDFIYWKQSQTLTGFADIATIGSSIWDSSHSVSLVQPGYKPGFQVGFGFNMKGMDHWNVYSEYTWYQNHYSKTFIPGSGEIIPLVPIGTSLVTATEKTSTIDLHYNNLNVSLERPFYFGKKLTSNFGCGLRALWLSQTFKSEVSGLSSISLVGDRPETALSGEATKTINGKSWSLGPRINMDSEWLLGCGFKVLGDLSVSILYTRYTDVTGTLQGNGMVGVHSLLNGSTVSLYDNPSFLTPVLETELGLGWGSYLGSNDGYHIDLSVGYDFNTFFLAPGKLFLYGLNIAARFDF